MKTLIVMLFSLSIFSWVNAQSTPMSVVSKVERGQIRIKWFPASYEQLKLFIDNGATIERVEIFSGQDPKTTDYSSAVKTVVEPAATRFAALNKADSSTMRIEAILEPFLSSSGIAEKEAQDFAFAILTLECSVSEQLGKVIGSDFTDTRIDKSALYAYRIRIKDSGDTYLKVDASQLTRYPSIEDLSLKMDQKNTVELTWKAASYTAFGYGFELEKSIDAPREGHYLTTTPYVPVRTKDEKPDKADFFRDHDLIEGKTHYYRLVGLDYFGKPALFSEWKKIYVPKYLHAEIFIDTIYLKDQARVIEGIAASIDSKPKNLTGYALLKSLKKDEGYQLVSALKTTDSTFRFSVPTPATGDQFYYKVVGYSGDKDSVFSMPTYFFTLDQQAPAAPAVLTGKIDSLGIVRITWQAPPDNDLQGYRIFRGNSKREDFTEKSTVLSLSTAFTDTLRLDNLTSQVYYFVQAVDGNYNNSASSDTLLLLKPDTIAPVAALMLSAQMKDSLIELSWNNSPSPDVAASCLLRLSSGRADTLAVWLKDSSSYSDMRIEPGKSYSYQIVTLDIAGNRSQSEPREVFFEPGYRMPLKGALALANPNSKSVDLSWELPAEPVFSFQIYKAKNDGTLMLIKTIENPHLNSYSDKNLSAGNTYTYTIKYVLASGIHSLPTKKMEVIF